jgi:hypothetical protein
MLVIQITALKAKKFKFGLLRRKRMKTVEDMIKDKIEEVLALMAANGDECSYGGTTYQLDDGQEVKISREWYSSSYNC